VWSNRDHKRIRKTFPTLAAAKAWRQDASGAVRRGGGIYTPRRAGALAGVSDQRIGRWARRRLITPSLYQGRPFNLYGYFDVAEAIVVRWLLKRGFEHADIRGALDSVRAEHPQ
jgi:hypothetical protein